ncbi:nuclear polyadenylated RNA-binding protein 3 [Vermiconidia calcicola]|uniref:Nuclear polyadenylated RNA-binding protein 3 n=1 Tax=Vermiconidia calcicola TaxID=1690605 RepID=A0ACC3M9V4_9PEZI|nr:nuclear polyadenylated RNA-binding protein 3 [Vermiconidia calcicola]
MSSETPEEPHLRSEPSILSPASPKPIHFPTPTNIPVLEMQMNALSGGRPLSAPVNKFCRTMFPKLAEVALTAIHRHKIRHNDAEPRNMIFDIASMRLMVIDLERSTRIPRPALAPMSSNGVSEQTNKKRIRYQSPGDELVAAVFNLLRDLRNFAGLPAISDTFAIILLLALAAAIALLLALDVVAGVAVGVICVAGISFILLVVAEASVAFLGNAAVILPIVLGVFEVLLSVADDISNTLLEKIGLLATASNVEMANSAI